LAGPDELYSGAFRQSGITRANSIAELFDFCLALGSLPLPKGDNVVLQTQSGGPGVAAADACGREGLKFPPLSVKTIKKLRPFVPHTATIKNPLDLTYTKNPIDYFGEIPEVLFEEANGDILLIYFLLTSNTFKRAVKQMENLKTGSFEQIEALIEDQINSLASLMNKYNKPIFGYTFHSLEESIIKRFLEKGIPIFLGPERAARAIKVCVDYGLIKKKSDR
jgi:acyl-CoA synthetase (NDP forming)